MVYEKVWQEPDQSDKDEGYSNAINDSIRDHRLKCCTWKDEYSMMLTMSHIHQHNNETVDRQTGRQDDKKGHCYISQLHFRKTRKLPTRGNFT